MGAVYQARQDAIDQDIAIKVLLSEAARSPEIVQRFHREAKVISMLTHPNIIRVFIFGRTEEGLLYLAMEFVKGRELREDLAELKQDELRVIRIMKQACSALAEAHDLGIIHRDLKPDNILLTDFRGDHDFVKILDFGIAKLTENQDASQAKLTQAGIVYGTPEYLSPEQAQALPLDHRTDIYSLGVMLYEMIVGRVPYMADSPVKILAKHVYEQPPRPNDITQGRVAPTMERIILKAMAKNPEERFDNALDMFRALVRREQEILTQRGLSRRRQLGAGRRTHGDDPHQGSDERVRGRARPWRARPARGQSASGRLHRLDVAPGFEPTRAARPRGHRRLDAQARDRHDLYRPAHLVRAHFSDRRAAHQASLARGYDDAAL